VPAYTMLPSRSAPALTMMAKNLVELKVYELKAVCKAKRLKVSGNKADLIRRIELSAQGIADAPRNGRRQSFADPAVARPQPPAAAPAAPARVPPASAPVVASISDASRAAPASSDAEVSSPRRRWCPPSTPCTLELSTQALNPVDAPTGHTLCVTPLPLPPLPHR
jgi:hypothetical protein